MDTERQSLYKRTKFAIQFLGDGSVRGFWPVHEIIRNDFTTKVNMARASVPYQLDTQKVDSLTRLADRCKADGNLVESVDLMHEAALIMKEAAARLSPPVEVEILFQEAQPENVEL